MNEGNNDVLMELKKITKLIALSITKGENQTTQISLLDSVGLKPKEIAELLNTTNNNVNVRLNALRKVGKKKKVNK